MKNLFLYIIILTLLASSCASRPVLYPNERYKLVGKGRAQEDIDRCMDESEKYLDSSQARRILYSGGKGLALGSVIGTASGIFTGDVVGGVAEGATVGGATGATAEALTPEQLKKAYVHHCLAKKGFQVIGWD